MPLASILSPQAAVISNTELWGIILDLLDQPDAVYRLRSVCHQMQKSTDRVLGRRFDVEKFLHPVFGEGVPAFREVQRATGALIGGSWAVSFFKGRSLHGMGPVDIVVAAKEYLALSYCLEMLGFIPHGEVTKRCLQNEIVIAIRSFVLELDETHVVRVVTTPESPVATILRSYITITLNFIGWDRAVSVFPLATFCDNEGLVLDCVDGDRPAIQRYSSQRGFKVIDKSLAAAPWNAGELAAGRRFLGDSRCWIVRLQGAPRAPTLPIPYMGNSFALCPAGLSGSKGGLQLCNYYLKFDTVEHPLLKHIYACCEACARFITICLRCIARRFPYGPLPSWTCYFVLSYDELEVTSCDELVRLLTEAWMQGRTLAVVTEGLVYRFDPELV